MALHLPLLGSDTNPSARKMSKTVDIINYIVETINR